MESIFLKTRKKIEREREGELSSAALKYWKIFSCIKIIHNETLMIKIRSIESLHIQTYTPPLTPIHIHSISFIWV